MTLLFLALLALIVSADPASAGLVSGAIAAASTAFKAVAATTLGKIALRLVATTAISLYQQRRQRQRLAEARKAGIQISVTTSGGTTPQGFILGRFATAGHLVYINSAGKNNYMLDQVIELSELPGLSLVEIIADGELIEPSQPYAHGQTVTGVNRRRTGSNPRDYMWATYYDGSQTNADPTLVETYGSEPERPWTASHVLSGLPYVHIRARASAKIWEGGRPQFRFVLEGLRLYDPRADGSVGGTGAQRWGDPATWAASENPVVMIYNILRGIALPGGDRWGGDAEAEDLPLTGWIAAMNACDTDIDGRPRYTAGLEVAVTQEPAEVIAELLEACSGQIAEFGGVWDIQVGAPSVPDLYIDDEDLRVDAPTSREPFNASTDRINAIAVTYTAPEMVWNAHQLTTLTHPDWEIEDGGRFPADLQLIAVTNAAQAAQVAEEMAADNRRELRHVLRAPPEFAVLRPLRTISWTSAQNGYDNKWFELFEMTLEPRTFQVVLSLRERDPSDFSSPSFLELPAPVVSLAPVTAQDTAVPGFAAVAWSERDGDGVARRPGIQISWDGELLADSLRGIAFQVIVRDTATEAWAGTTPDLERGRFIVQPLLPDTWYRVRAQGVSDVREMPWTPWIDVRTPDVRFAESDLADSLRDKIDEARALHDQALETATGTLGALRDQIDEDRLRLERSLPDITDARRDIDTVWSEFLALTERQWQTETRMVDAGIVTDPETGTITLRAVQGLEGRQVELEQKLDAAEATITTRASVAYVDQAIAMAVLDPSQLPAFEGLDIRLTNAEQTLSAETGRIDTLTDTLTVSGGLVTMATVSQQLDSLNTALTQRVTVSEYTQTVNRVSAAEQTLSVIGDTSAITNAVQETRRIALDSDLAQAENIADIWRNWERDRAAVEADARAREELRATVSDEMTAEAEARLQLEASLGDSVALIDQTVRAQANATAALADQTQTLQSSVTNLGNEVVARVLDLEATRVDANGARAAIQTEISASFGSIEAMASAAATAEATASGITAGFVFRLNGANALELVSVAQGTTTGAKITGKIASDYLQITGLTQMDEAVIRDLAVDNAFVEDLRVGRLNIPSGTVTLPVRAQDNTTLTLSSHTTLIPILQLTIDRQAGFVTDFQFGCGFDGNFAAGSGVMITFELYRNGIKVRETTVNSQGSRQGTVTWVGADFDTGGGTTTYQVRARKVDPTLTGGWDLNPRIFRRYLSVQQFMR